MVCVRSVSGGKKAYEKKLPDPGVTRMGSPTPCKVLVGVNGGAGRTALGYRVVRLSYDAAHVYSRKVHRIKSEEEEVQVSGHEHQEPELLHL